MYYYIRVRKGNVPSNTYSNRPMNILPIVMLVFKPILVTFVIEVSKTLHQ